MMARPVVQKRAREDVDAIADHIARDNLSAALRFLTASEAAFTFLASNPGAGPRVEPPLPSVPDLRFWPISRFRAYLVLYRVLPDGVEVLRVIHGARDLARAMRGA
jgi:toxin ParE1/3/4